MKNYLSSKEYLRIIEDDIVVCAYTILDQCKLATDRKLENFKTNNFLFKVIDRYIIETILICDMAKDILDSMNKKCQGSRKVKCAQLQSLRHEFEFLVMKDGKLMDEYFTQTLAILNRI